MKTPLLLFLAILALPITGFSTHLRGGQIRVIPQNNPLTCIIELTVYTDTRSEIKFGEGLLDFGDGSNVTTPTTENIKRSDIFVGLGMVKYTTTHTYAKPGNYLVTYLEPNLTGGILNIFNSVETRFYIETYIVLNTEGTSTSPEFLAEPIFICETGNTYSFSTAAVNSSANDFFYQYSLVLNPKEIKNFRVPENLKIDKNSGIITWDTEFEGNLIQGQIWFVVKIEKFSEDGNSLGYVTRAWLIDVEDRNSQIDMTSSVDDSNNEVVVTEGKEKVVKVVLTDFTYPDALHFDLYTNERIKANVSLNQYDSMAGSLKFRVAKLSFKTTADIVSEMPYAVTLRGVSNLWKDISLLYMTKDIPIPEIITGAEKAVEQKLNVYPNPFRSELYVDGTEAILINTLGQIVLTSSPQKGEPINTSALPSGFYILQIVDADGTKRNVRLIRN